MKPPTNLTLSALVAAGATLSSFSTVSHAALLSTPGSTIVLVNGTNDGDGNSGAPPANEGVGNSIDGTTNKYLNFLDLGSGFAIQPSGGSSVATSLRFYTANDAEERDPASYLIEGSNSTIGGGYVTISSGALALPIGRNNVANQAVGDAAFFQDVTFANTTAYLFYRVTFPTLKNAGAANSMQIGEVQINGDLVPEPTTAVFGALVGAGLLMRRRRA